MSRCRLAPALCLPALPREDVPELSVLVAGRQRLATSGESRVSQMGRGSGSPTFPESRFPGWPGSAGQALPAAQRDVRDLGFDVRDFGFVHVLLPDPSLQDCPPPYFSSSQRLVGPQCRASRLESGAENAGVQVTDRSPVGAGGGGNGSEDPDDFGKRLWLWGAGELLGHREKVLESRSNFGKCCLYVKTCRGGPGMLQRTPWCSEGVWA